MTPEEIKQATETLDKLWKTSQYNEAKAFAYELLEEQSIQDDAESHSKVMNLLGVAYYNLSDYPKSLEFYEKSLKIFEEIGNKGGIATNLGNIGLVYRDLSDYPKALEYYEKALYIQEEIGNKVGIARNLGNIGLVYRDLSDYPKALEYYSKALLINEEIGNKAGIAVNLGNIGLVYLNLSDYPKALEYYEKALLINEEIGNKDGIATNLGNLGGVYSDLSDYSKALVYYSKALLIAEEIGKKASIATNLGNIGNVYHNLSDYPKALEYYSKALQINEEIGNKDGIASYLMNVGIVYHNLSDYPKALEYYEKALHFFEEIGNKSSIAINLGNIGIVYKELSDYPKALEYYEKALSISEEIGNKRSIAINLENIGSAYATKESTYYDAKKAEEFLQNAFLQAEEIGYKEVIKEIYKILSSLYSNEKQFEEAFEFQSKARILKEEIQSIEAKKQADSFHIQRKLAEQEIQMAEERGRLLGRESILRNILPDSVTDRLVKGENPIADHFDSASVLFMDLVGFTTLASIAPPKQLVFLLDAIFQKADDVVEQFGLEKIKTIGDGYLAVANVTSPLENHQYATASAALALLQGMKELVVSFPDELGSSEWTKNMQELQIRIGIHTGEVVAGVIGRNKYTYDLWGDAVNVASRMESNSKAGRIHISEQFATSIKAHPEFKLIPRGTITIKGKGTMNTFWLEKEK